MKQNQEWIWVFVAAIFEIGWVVGLKYANSTLEWVATIIAIVISFGLLIRAGQRLPVGTVYAVFVGMGTVGTVILDTLLFAEPLRLSVLLFIALLLTGVIGLKITTESPQVGRESE
ncbi:DMT family transporter [Halalkalibacter nanhaiisediminis]|uniref:Paired small multidrug resistance pump n=1 Tax=Halalkalibacter nanhaiisediminis TaxID=688079 RepID=A0A562QSS5_9BACI|nr:multidrug efflux SMR transporter [Halalkalibacter nanhaiisediminis]TWI59703.1 paired small multidrug resistance pump [Halalkalibacter nanhaiisediminis]